MSDIRTDKEQWDSLTEMLGNESIRLGRHWSYNLRNDPKRLGFVLSRYKFSAKMGTRNRTVLELGCSEGIGTPILSEFATSYTGIDMDAPAIETARQNWGSEKCSFISGDFLGQEIGSFETVVSLDVVEHIEQEYEHLYFQSILRNLRHGGIALVGTPNVTSDAYASPASKAGHVNLFDGNRLVSELKKYFHNVFLFGINDEVVHTGFVPMAHYLMALACNPRSGK